MKKKIEEKTILTRKKKERRRRTERRFLHPPRAEVTICFRYSSVRFRHFREAAQQRATLGMGLVAGYDLSEAPTDDAASQNKLSKGGSNYGIVTDAETSYTVRLMLITLIPFFVLLLTKVFSSSNGRRLIILIAHGFTTEDSSI
ncbi:sodium/calcium exchanger family protein /calcium-binding EF hand family protein [Striga asiatica]|uniref:Sodium/calcium exchanger family protein /calcium-binding EF hand family protein n=1 Tax=Striga asiatica TaxID=4170 RepID=A0A5A7QPG7_STRAF|nr:sodium/calcium exchanger family protein /calcium-binding EF hand family protein [Striga asiatica]